MSVLVILCFTGGKCQHDVEERLYNTTFEGALRLKVIMQYPKPGRSAELEMRAA